VGAGVVTGSNVDDDGGARADTRAAKPPTIYDVARLAGVSHQTVSRYMAGYAGIRPETRERVTKALEALDYRPNMSARFLATNRSHRIGALAHDIGQVGPSKTLQGAIAGAREAGYMLDVISLDVGDEDAVHDALAMITRQDIAGLLAFSSTDAMTRALRDTTIRVPTLIDVEEDDAIAGHRATGNYRGLQLLIDHLVSQGHRRFFHIAGPSGWIAARNRALSYDRALASHGLTSLGTAHGDWSAESGYRIAERLVPGLEATALVVANDQMALGAMLALDRQGIRVPADVSITGFDDIPESAFYRPPLTTVRIDFDVQGRAALGRLLQRIRGVDVERETSPAVELVLRESVGPARLQ
jgi:DNA-binding LacI/PurR family transcriptional regulator